MRVTDLETQYNKATVSKCRLAKDTDRKMSEFLKKVCREMAALRGPVPHPRHCGDRQQGLLSPPQCQEPVTAAGQHPGGDRCQESPAPPL